MLNILWRTFLNITKSICQQIQSDRLIKTVCYKTRCSQANLTPVLTGNNLSDALEYNLCLVRVLSLYSDLGRTDHTGFK